MKNFIIATDQGQTISPYGKRCENSQILGFAQGNTKEEAIEDFINYMEDEDLCLRAWKLGIPVIYYPDAKMTHNHLRGSSHLSKKTLYHLKSFLTYLRRHGLNAKRVVVD